MPTSGRVSELTSRRGKAKKADSRPPAAKEVFKKYTLPREYYWDQLKQFHEAGIQQSGKLDVLDVQARVSSSFPVDHRQQSTVPVGMRVRRGRHKPARR